jgi:hypothetical protein
VAAEEVEAGQGDSMETVQSLRFEAGQEVAVEVVAGATAETTSKIETLERRRLRLQKQVCSQRASDVIQASTYAHTRMTEVSTGGGSIRLQIY